MKRDKHRDEEGGPPCVLLVFVDGLGFGSRDPAINPLYRGDSPCLADWIEHDAVAVDACLDLPGTPQSATGQASLLTGRNAAMEAGRHVAGFPTESLKILIREHNLFTQLTRLGYRSTFANAYYLEDPIAIQRRRQSVTTVATLAAFGSVRDLPFLLRDEAVYQDLTRESLRDRGYTGPLTTPGEAAEHLLRIAVQHDFTLFEYFQTDFAAHSGSDERRQLILRRLDAFLDSLRNFSRTPGNLFLLTSDHGNIEDAHGTGHTRNPVPLIARGRGAAHMKSRVKSLTDFVPALLELYPKGAP
ncbi:MAG: hypothetical protein U1E27_12540 [Kiritimatiellia bacterium]|nr:hypothetical protein [Kiritimatiellia bacterium]